jgi:diacylglycerol kinase family enzyme
MKFKNIIILYNPLSGRFSLKKLNFIQYYLNNLNITTTTFNLINNDFYDKLNNSSNDFLSSYDAVFVAGGDGSLNHVINKLVFTDIPIAHLPMGTVNLFAIENKTPFNIKKALYDIINKYQPVKINIGKINNKFFLIMAGIGFDAYVVKNFEEELQLFHNKFHKFHKINNMLKYLKYARNVINILKKYKFIDISVDIFNEKNKIIENTPFYKNISSLDAVNKTDYGNRHLEKSLTNNNGNEPSLYNRNIIARQVIVSNLKYYGGPFKLFPDSSCFDDNLNIRVIKNVNNRFNALLCIIKSILFHKQYIKNTDYYIKAKKITVSASDENNNSKIYCQCDGEFIGTLPVEIEKVKNAITLLVSPDSEIMI